MAVPNTSPTEFGDRGVPKPPRREPGEEQDIVRHSWARFEKAKQHKITQANPNDWKRFALIFGDQHWDGSQKEWQATPTINLSFAAVNTILPIMTDQRPQWAALPREPQDARIANVIRALLEWIWEEQCCDTKLPRTMLNTLIFGNGFWKVVWNPSLRKGLGDIEILNVDPVNMFFNPEATSMEDAEEIFHVEIMSMRKVRRLWPEQFASIEPGVKDPSVIVDRPHLPQFAQSKGSVSVQTTDGSSVWTYPSGGRSRLEHQPKEVATIIEYWRIDPDSNRWHRTLAANDVLLEDEETEFETPPFVHFVDHAVPWTIWGTGEIQHVESLQYEINKRRGMVLDILRHYSIPILVYDPSGGADLDNVEIEPGLSVAVEGGASGAAFLQPNVDIAGLLSVNDRDKQDFNDILGSVEVLGGKRPVGIEAAAAIDSLTENANNRMRSKIRNMEASLVRAGKVILAYIQKHYTTRRIFRVVGNEFAPGGQPNLASPEQFTAINDPTGINAETGELELANAIPQDAHFDIRVGAGSTLPVSRTARFQKAITLFDRGALPIKELLVAADWPRAEEVAMEMEQKAAMAQAAQQGGVMPQADPVQEDFNIAAGLPDELPGLEEQPAQEGPDFSGGF